MNQSSGGLSRARLNAILGNYRPPAPVPTDVVVTAPDATDVELEIIGLNIVKDTAVVFARDDAPDDATIVVTDRTVVPSTKNGLGSVTVKFDSTGLDAAVNQFQIFLTGAKAQRVYVGALEGSGG